MKSNIARPLYASHWLVEPDQVSYSVEGPTSVFAFSLWLHCFCNENNVIKKLLPSVVSSHTPNCVVSSNSHVQAWCVCAVCSVAQSCLTLCNPMDCSPPSSSAHGILQARTLEWVAGPFSRGLSQSRHPIWVSHIAGRFFTIWATWN